MQFLYPTFLFALAALAIPIIIHLFYFRRFKKVYFTNVRFLKEVKEEKSARSKLRNLLVLAMRLLALAFLVFAFAQPFIPRDEEVKAGVKAVSIFEYGEGEQVVRVLPIYRFFSGGGSSLRGWNAQENGMVDTTTNGGNFLREGSIELRKNLFPTLQGFTKNIGAVEFVDYGI